MGPVGIELTAGTVAAFAGGALVAGDAGQRFTGVSIDTRTLQPGELFIAIRGERFDGAAFVDAAVAGGATGVLVPRGTGGVPTASATSAVAVVEVDDTTTALQSLARAIRREAGTKVVAITGSAGKTTTKEITSELLSTRYRVIRNRGNFNNHIGQPLSLVELRTRPDVAVVELGMNHAGEISTLVRIAEPDVRVWTNVGEAHLGFFASVDAIADAKAEILDGAGRGDLLVANADDPRIVSRVRSFAGRVVTFAIDHEADVRASSIDDRGIDGTSARVTTARGTVELTTPLVGRTNLANLLAATAVALEFDIPLPEIAAKAQALRPASHRGEIVRLGSGITVIDDSYNANPTATKRAIEVLGSSRARRRIAVIGEMLELGNRAEDLHADVGRAVAAGPVDLLFTVGGAAAKALADAAIDAGMSSTRVQHFPTSDDAADTVASAVADGDLVLVKGSRGIKTDRIVERLKVRWGS
jgi:UDP-N-acetylmuramoyl-tripeptide--D-alanyl-D-alanine ligase